MDDRAKIVKARIISNNLDAEYSRNVLSMISRIEIQEYIFSPFLRANITISDSEGMFEAYNISGGEVFQLDILFPTAEPELFFTHNFFVYTVSPLAFATETSYTLELISLDYAVNTTNRISKSFRGMSADKIIESIYNDYIKTESIGNELFISHQTNNPMNVIIPNISTYKALNFITARSTSKENKYSCFLFFRNLFSYNFIDIFTYANEQNVNPLLNYKLGMANKAGGEGEEITSYKITSDASDLTISDIAIKIGNDYLEGIHKDVFAGKTIVHDPLTKENKMHEFSISENFKDLSKDESPHIFSKSNNILTPDIIESDSTNKLHYKGNNTKFKHYENIFARNYMVYSINNSIRISYVNENPTGLCVVGQLINLTVPTVDLEKKQDNKTNPEPNIKLSGKYIVSKVTHIFEGSVEESDYTISTQAFKAAVDPR
jgi:hypothetical protein